MSKTATLRTFSFDDFDHFTKQGEILVKAEGVCVW